jgi:hypothetical protein
MNYRHLTEADQAALTRDRILSLEGDHYRLSLILAETTDPDRTAQLMGQRALLEAAIAVHAAEEAPVAADKEPTDGL